jgi:murein L,D-transpeptidase YcbB/YkuD
MGSAAERGDPVRETFGPGDERFEGRRERRRLAGMGAVALLVLTTACGGDEAPPSQAPESAASDSLPVEPGGPPNEAIAATVEQVLASGDHPWLKWSEIPDVTPVLSGLYAAEPDRLLWFAGETPYPGLGGALDALAGAAEHGLDPEDYDAALLRERWTTIESGGASDPERALFDVALSVDVARLLTAARVGRVDPAVLHWGYDVPRKPIDVSELVRKVRGAEGVSAALAELEPPLAHYRRARQALARYEALASQGEPEPVPDLEKGRTKVEPGDTWEGVPALAARLLALGDLAPGEGTGAVVRATLYEGPVVEAVERFQWRHGLEEDGVIGKGTLAALNVPVAARARQLQLALERERWLPDLGEEPTVFVNVALFRLWATDPGTEEEPVRMNVVVGKSLHHRTPIFIEEMEYVVFRPYWNPPYGITVREIVPHARRDPSYVESHDFEIVASGSADARALPATPENLEKVVAATLHIRQKPGPRNSLGLAKFIFPNDENVYMHGTPAQQLFSRARRDFSHGCIRLEDPARLGEWVLRDQPEWTRERIDAAMQGERPTRVDLKTPLKVVLFYVTAQVDSEGVVHFAEDIYGHDEILDDALRQGYPYPTAATAAGRS